MRELGRFICIAHLISMGGCYLKCAQLQLVLQSQMISTAGSSELCKMEGKLSTKHQASIASERKSERGISD